MWNFEDPFIQSNHGLVEEFLSLIAAGRLRIRTVEQLGDDQHTKKLNTLRDVNVGILKEQLSILANSPMGHCNPLSNFR